MPRYATNSYAYSLGLTSGFHRLAATHNGSRWTLYVDGASVNSTGATNGALDLAGPWYLGGYLDRAFIGTIREVRIYDRALSAEHIAAIHAATD